MALTLPVAAQAAAPPALNSLGQAGGLVIPYAFALPEGTAEAQYNNFLDPRFGARATGAQMYWGAVGLLPYVEVSGGLANYPGNVPAAFSGADHFLFRHLMADVKVQVPRFFRYQPAIAFGMTDVGGQTHYFRSTYGVVSQSFGPATLSVGYGQGDRLNGIFGGAEVSLWNTGASLLVEDDSKTPYAGFRYQSPGVSWLAGASFVGTVLRSLRSTNGVAPRTSFSVGMQIPLGHRFDASPVEHTPADSNLQANIGVGDNLAAHAGALPPDMRGLAAELPPASHVDIADRDFAVAPTRPAIRLTRAGVDDVWSGRERVAQLPEPAKSDSVVDETAALDTVAAQLFAAGLERVRVGVRERDLIVEYENHRYNQNEADALGIVLGVASAGASREVERIHAVIKKDNQVLGEMTVTRDAYVQFLVSGTPGDLATSMTMRFRPDYDANSVEWHGDEHRHGLTRLEVRPIASYLFGTEYGNLDASIGVNVVGHIPLWKGAELIGSYVVPIYHTANMDDGRVYSKYRLQAGLSDAALAQSFWIAPQVLNVLAVGKFDFHYVGAENETTLFVPGRPDLVRLRLAYLHQQPGTDHLPHEINASLTYRWVQPAWKLWVEAGAARFVGGDKGPLITFTRWFDDVSFSVHAEHSGQGTYAGLAIGFPLTPRQGMKPGITQIDGADHFALDFRTRVGAPNYVAPNAIENLGFAYGTQKMLLNEGRFSAQYFATQLKRMRDAYERYAAAPTGLVTVSRSSGAVSAIGATKGRVACANFYRATGAQAQQLNGCQ
ncbi:YjbH domain-containing protein [Paraburkholderia phymatum]|uniref:YjbH domain-containing protein n=1 Tax=Paraburkholderia phymatum TaxID=148447 RepID=A0ACC6UC09_9BURK